MSPDEDTGHGSAPDLPPSAQVIPRLVSVVIPAHNAQRYLAPAIDSVLAQEYQDLEILVIDDGSSDATEAVARDYDRVRCHRQRQQGAAAARNRGISLSRGEFIAFLDADDLWEPHKLRLQVAALAADAAVGVVFGHVRQFHSPELSATDRGRIHCPEAPMPGRLPSAALTRKAVFHQVGLFESAEIIDYLESRYAL